MISFVFYFHSSRINNLKQTLRLLLKREKSIKEVVLVCNDRTDEIFEGCNLHNMEMNEYNKPKMCNLGVSKASEDLVVLLDSDRILPRGYFDKLGLELRMGQFASCRRMFNIKYECSDEQIEAEDFEFAEEERSMTWEVRRKNLFSGNTAFFKRDYLDAGGLDESFVGYGFADNDMTLNVMNKGMTPVWSDSVEYHLYHEKSVMEDGGLVGFAKYQKTSQSNLNRFIKKWKLKELMKFYGPIV